MFGGLAGVVVALTVYTWVPADDHSLHFFHELLTEPQHILVEFSDGIGHLGHSVFRAEKCVRFQGRGRIGDLV